MTPAKFTSFASDDVLEAFMLENHNPSALALETWMRRFPDHAEELLKFAPILRHQANRPTPRDDQFMAIITSLYEKFGYEPTDDQWAQCALDHKGFSADILEYAEAARIAGPYQEGKYVELTPEEVRRAEQQAEDILDGFHLLERLQARVEPGLLKIR